VRRGTCYTWRCLFADALGPVQISSCRYGYGVQRADDQRGILFSAFLSSMNGIGRSQFSAISEVLLLLTSVRLNVRSTHRCLHRPRGSAACLPLAHQLATEPPHHFLTGLRTVRE
jgi:hypothetical protein